MTTIILFDSNIVLKCFSTFICVPLPCKRSKLSWSQIGEPFFEKNSFIKVIHIHCLLIKFVQSFVVLRKKLRRKKVICLRRVLDNFTKQLVLEKFLELTSYWTVDVHSFDRKHLHNFISDYQTDFALLGLFGNSFLLLNNCLRHKIVPSKSDHESNRVCKHASVFNEVEGFKKSLVFCLNVK